MRYRKATERVCNKTLDTAKLVINGFNHLYIQRQCYFFATGNTMCRRIKSQYFIIFFYQCTYICIKIFADDSKP